MSFFLEPNHPNVHPESEAPFQVTESGEPLTVHPRPHVELQLQRPFDHVTPSSVRGRKNPMRKFIQGWRNVLKRGIKMNPKLMPGHGFQGRRSPSSQKFKSKSGGGPRGHFNPMKHHFGGVGDSVVVFEAEASTDSNVFVEDDFTSEEMKRKMDSDPMYKGAEEIMKMSPTNGKRNEKSESTEQGKNSNREPKMMLYDYDEDYYEDLTDELSVNDRLQNLFKKEFDEKFFKK